MQFSWVSLLIVNDARAGIEGMESLSDQCIAVQSDLVRTKARGFLVPDLDGEGEVSVQVLHLDPLLTVGTNQRTTDPTVLSAVALNVM